jgi:hypothetical protein
LKAAYINRVAVHPMVTVPAMFHGRVAVLLVVAKVAAIQEGQFGFNFQQMFAAKFQNQAASATVGARFGRAANNSFTKFKFNQAWLAESCVTDSSKLVAILQDGSHVESPVLVGSEISLTENGHVA